VLKADRIVGWVKHYREGAVEWTAADGRFQAFL
jgi:hypothetical protein